jgi:hypothetical protein
MRKRIVETKDVERIEITCDDCGKILNIYNRSHTCCMCRKDLCEVCYGTKEYAGSGGGDYPPVYCRDCLDIGKPYIINKDHSGINGRRIRYPPG